MGLDVTGGTSGHNSSRVGGVAETLTRGSFNVRIERVGRPEVKNMMLAPKQFDTVIGACLFPVDPEVHAIGCLRRRKAPR
jgi:hypothetical protein